MLALALPLVALFLPPGAEAQSGSVEYAIKATYIYKFAPFVEWPSLAFPDASTPLSICLMRADRLRDLVERVVAGQTMDGRPITVESINGIDPGHACHILFIGLRYGPDLATTLARARDTSSLTITDGVSDPALKGIINFVVDRNRVRF